MSSPTVRVLIVDDHPLFREGLAQTLAREEGVEVVGEVATGAEAVAAATAARPDVVLMDLNMPGLSGVEATRRILAVRPATRVLVLTMFDQDESIFAALRAGARGYLLKGSAGDDVLRAVRAVAAGEAIFAPAVAERLASYFTPSRAAGPLPFPDLTEREREVLDHLARGRSNADIAAATGISLKTVRNHVSNVLTKLRVTTRGEAIVAAREAGLGSDPA